ncbi:MAG: ATP-binding cassette domain-containing protein [Reinekea sp.]
MLEVRSVRLQQGQDHFYWDFQLNAGQFMAITGGSGVGKTTLLNCLLGFAKADSGSVLWQGEDLVSVPVQHRPFGVLFQQHNLFEHLTVEKNLALGLSPSARLSAEQKQKLQRYAQRFQISDLLKKKSTQLSGGQQQRIALARVFLQNKPVLLLDEPFSSLDPALRLEGLKWVSELKREQNTTVLMVTHHLAEIQNDVDIVMEGVSSQQWNQYPVR